MDDGSITFSRRFNQFKISISRRNVSDKTFLKYYDELNKTLNLPKEIQAKSLEVFEKISRKDILRSKDFRYMVAACIIAASRNANIYVAPNSFSAKAKSRKVPDELDPVLVMRSYKRILGVVPDFRMGETNYDSVISTVGNKLMVSNVTVDNAKNRCAEFLEEFKKRSRTFKPSAVAAASLYVSCQSNGEPRTQKEISKEAGVSEVTIRNILRDVKL